MEGWRVAERKGRGGRREGRGRRGGAKLRNDFIDCIATFEWFLPAFSIQRRGDSYRQTAPTHFNKSTSTTPSKHFSAATFYRHPMHKEI